MVHVDELRERIAEYLVGDASLASLERWLHASNVPLVVDGESEASRDELWSELAALEGASDSSVKTSISRTAVRT